MTSSKKNNLSFAGILDETLVDISKPVSLRKNFTQGATGVAHILCFLYTCVYKIDTLKTYI